MIYKGLEMLGKDLHGYNDMIAEFLKTESLPIEFVRHVEVEEKDMILVSISDDSTAINVYPENIVLASLLRINSMVSRGNEDIQSIYNDMLIEALVNEYLNIIKKKSSDEVKAVIEENRDYICGFCVGMISCVDRYYTVGTVKYNCISRRMNMILSKI